MIYDKISNFMKYLPLLHKYGITSDILQKTSTNKNIIYISKEYDMNLQKMEVFEYHKRDIDIHYIQEGIEKIDITDTPCKPIPYSETDCYLFYNNDDSNSITLSKNEFIIFFPHECHRINPYDNNIVKKQIIKIDTTNK